MLRKLLILSCLCFAVIVFAQNKKKASDPVQNGNSETIDYKKLGAPLPPFRLIVPTDLSKAGKATTADSTGHTGKYEYNVVTEKELASNANLLIMTFNPTCEHCQDETELFKKNIQLFKKTRIILVASAQMVPYLEFFNNSLHVTDFPKTFTLGVDSAQYIEKTFLYQSLPQINIYDHNRKMIKAFTGEVAIDSLKQYIE